MKKVLLLLPLLGVLPLSAESWEVGVFAGQQAYNSSSISNSVVSVTANVDNKAAFGLRAGYEFSEAGAWGFQATVGYLPQVNSSAKINMTVQGVSATAQAGTYSSSQVAVGGMAYYKSVVNLGAGLEYRFENLKATSADPNLDSISTNYSRPWVRLVASYPFPMGSVKGFVGLEAGLPLTSTNLKISSTGVDDSNFLKSFAPKSQVGAYLGVQF